MTYKDTINKLFSDMAKCQNIEVLNFISWCLGMSDSVYLAIRFCEATDLLAVKKGVSLIEAAQTVMPQEEDDSLECEQFHAYVQDFIRLK